MIPAVLASAGTVCLCLAVAGIVSLVVDVLTSRPPSYVPRHLVRR